MLPFAPQDEPWDQEMEVFGGSASSVEVSMVAKRGWGHPLPPLKTVAGGPRGEGAWGWEARCQARPLRLRGGGQRSARTALSLGSRRGLGGGLGSQE